MDTNETDTTTSNETCYTIEQFMIAAETNDFQMCHKILATNPQLINSSYPTIVNWLDKSPYNAGAKAINYAARSGHYDMVYVLINKYKADIQAKDHEDWNSLHYACNAGHYPVTKYLIENNVDDTIISIVEQCTPLGFAEYKKWNDIIHLFKTNGIDDNNEIIKQYNYGLIEKQKILKKTKARLDKLILASDSMTDQKLCRYYKPFVPLSCRDGVQCPYAHIDIDYNKLNENKNIKLDLYMHRYKINLNIYYKLNENLCNNDTQTLIFKCIDTQLKQLYKNNKDINEDGMVWFIIYHDRYNMHQQRKAFEGIKDIRVIRSGSISRLDHILVLKVNQHKVKILHVFRKIIGDKIDIVEMDKNNDNDNDKNNDNDNDIESKNNDVDMTTESKQTDNYNEPDISPVLNNLCDNKLFVGYGDHSAVSLVNYSLFDKININSKYSLIKACIDSDVCLDRAIGSIYGMGIGDATGAPLEFLDCIQFHNKSYFSLQNKQWTGEYNKFNLRRGQWTDDAAMGLCMADSLIKYEQFNGSDIRIRFWCWWNNGYNNAFRYDLKRHMKNSVGLGNNISKSLYSMKCNKTPSAAFKSSANKDDSGNGSLMRLAPIPIFFSCSHIDNAMKYAKYSSFTTHQGHIAAEACALMTFVIINGIKRDINNSNKNENIKVFLERVTNEYLIRINSEYSELLKMKKKNKTVERKIFAKKCIIKLLNCAETNNSRERCWNWKSKKGDLGIDVTMINRGSKYNGYPNSEGYFGSYCMDGIAMGLYSVYNSNSFGDAIENAVNLLGDADSTGSIAGQIAGAFYGFKNVFYNKNNQGYLFKLISQWDKYDFGLRAILLYCIGKRKFQTEKIVTNK